MEPIASTLRLFGAVSPSTALTTAQVVGAVADPTRLVYTELIRSADVARIDMEEEDGMPTNGWYALPRTTPPPSEFQY